MQLTVKIQSDLIAQLEQKIEELTKQNHILDKRSKDIFGEYQLLQYEIRSLPTQQEFCKLRLELLNTQNKLKAFEDFEKGA